MVDNNSLQTTADGAFNLTIESLVFKCPVRRCLKSVVRQHANMKTTHQMLWDSGLNFVKKPHKTTLPLIASLFFGGLAHCLGQGTLQINFNGSPAQSPGTGAIIQQYTESGMSFTPLPGDVLIRNGGGMPGYPDNGSAYLQGGSLSFGFSDGTLFGLNSVDLAGYSDAVPDFSVEFIGYLFNGSIVTQSFSGSGIAFQTFSFGPQFTGLTQVEISTPDWSLDNLVVSVPEPGVSQFAILGLLSIIAGARKSRPSVPNQRTATKPAIPAPLQSNVKHAGSLTRVR